MPPIHWIDGDDHTSPFPDVETALDEPNGLLAIGGPLSRQRLALAYRSGVFPWFSDDQPVLWWAPDPRALIIPGAMHLSRSLRKRLRGTTCTVTLDTDFRGVMAGCAGPRRDGHGTWITAEMQAAYGELHDAGIAHSVEVRRGNALVGGLYGLSLGRAFFGESMFSRERDVSKMALAWLCAQLWRWSFDFIDCQMPTGHLARLGARTTSRAQYMKALEATLRHPTLAGSWHFEADVDPADAGADGS